MLTTKASILVITIWLLFSSGPTTVADAAPCNPPLNPGETAIRMQHGQGCVVGTVFQTLSTNPPPVKCHCWRNCAYICVPHYPTTCGTTPQPSTTTPVAG